jgi:hypothetical protein
LADGAGRRRGPVRRVELDTWRRRMRQTSQTHVPETKDSTEVMMCI